MGAGGRAEGVWVEDPVKEVPFVIALLLELVSNLLFLGILHKEIGKVSSEKEITAVLTAVSLGALP